MVDSIDPIAPVQPTTPPFETAAMQIAQAQAQADAAHASEVTFLQDIAKANDASNAQTLAADGATTTTTASTDSFLNGLLNIDTSAEPSADPTLSLINDVSTDPTSPAGSGFNAQQLHDIAILQKDALQLEEAAASEASHIPLGPSASTVDLSVEAQGIVSGTTTVASAEVTAASPTPAQLAQVAAIVQPIANAPLTSDFLQQIQTQLAAEQNPIQLSLNIISLAMNFIVGMQPNPHHEIETPVTPADDELVAPVAATASLAIEDGAIDHNRHSA